MENPKRWGRFMWTFIHMCAARAKTYEQRRRFVIMLEAIINNLPCEKCRQNAKKFHRENDINSYMSSNELLFQYTWMEHDNVNKINNVPPENRLSLAEARKLYYSVSKESVEYEEDVSECVEICTTQRVPH